MYILCMVLHFSSIDRLSLIMHEIRAELKVDTESGQKTMRQGHVISISQYFGDLIAADRLLDSVCFSDCDWCCGLV